MVAPAALRRPDAGAPCGCTRHAALGTAHERGVTRNAVPPSRGLIQFGCISLKLHASPLCWHATNAGSRRRNQPFQPSVRTGHFISIISIIGTGNMARTIATLAKAGGNTVEVIGRDQSKAAELAKTLGGSTTTGEFGTVPAGDVVILAVLFDSAVSIVGEYGDALAGKTIVDITNPFNATADGLAIPAGTSVAQM